jgi:uncharacterized protein (DUF1778 family)
MPETRNREAPINIRARLTQRNLIDKAAAMLNKNRSDFMLEVACREAENVLLDRRLFLVDDEGYQAFETLLNAPVNDNPELRRFRPPDLVPECDGNPRVAKPA